ncbi:MAG: DnaD domain protein [Halanaerobiaceae bacterium]
MDKIDIYQQQTLKITSGKKSQSVELGADIIEAGFLHKFPGPTLAIFLYLITHFEGNNYFITTTIETICRNVPYEIKKVNEGLNLLQENDIIMINKLDDKNEELQIYINFEKVADLSEDKKPDNKTTNQKDNNSSASSTESGQRNEHNQQEILKSFIPEDLDNRAALKEIDKWQNDFDKKVIQELIRRVKKWQKNNNHDTKQAYYYLKTIIEDWYDKEIFSYERLQHFDQLYRETKELAQTYGLNNWKNVNTVQMKTFKSWLTDDFSLSLEVAKLAIKEAIKRKKDGQPSLKYIEDNYIIPWKNAEIKTTQQAKNYLAENRNSNHRQSTQQNDKTETTSWDTFPWKINKITQGGTS